MPPSPHEQNFSIMELHLAMLISYTLLKHGSQIVPGITIYVTHYIALNIWLSYTNQWNSNSLILKSAQIVSLHCQPIMDSGGNVTESTHNKHLWSFQVVFIQLFKYVFLWCEGFCFVKMFFSARISTTRVTQNRTGPNSSKSTWGLGWIEVGLGNVAL